MVTKMTDIIILLQHKSVLKKYKTFFFPISLLFNSISISLGMKFHEIDYFI